MSEQPIVAVEDVIADYQRRLEQLVDTFWPEALAGDHKSADLCRRLLAQHAALFGIGGASGVTVSSTPDDADDELAKLRARRTAD